MQQTGKLMPFTCVARIFAAAASFTLPADPAPHNGIVALTEQT